MTGHDIHQNLRYPHPRQIIERFKRYCIVWITYLETDTYNQDELNYQFFYKQHILTPWKTVFLC